MVMMMSQSRRVAVASELFITGDLIRVEQGAGFEMRRQMHRAQAALQLGNGRRLGGKAIWCDFARGKELVEDLFLRDQFAAERLRGGAHAVKDRLHIAVLLMLAVGFAEHAAALFALIPIGAVGSLLIFAGTDLAISRRLFDGQPSCLWVIGTTALVTVTINPALALVVGWIAELIRAAIVRRFVPERPKP